MGQTSDAADGDWHGPCGAPGRSTPGEEPLESWDLDVGDIQSWLRARRVCLERCPFLRTCQEHLRRLYPSPAMNPGGVIWAGVPYSDTGQVLDTDGLRRLSATRRGRAAASSPASAQAKEPR